MEAEVPSREALLEHVLKSYDRNFEEIIDTAPLVALYYKEKNTWEKLPCEGVLYIYRKCYEPFYNMFLLNRLNPTHFYEPITSNTTIETDDDQYLTIKNDEGSLYCMWFHEPSTFSRISEEIRKAIYNVNLQSFCMATNRNAGVMKMQTRREQDDLVAKYSLNVLRENRNASSKNVTQFFQEASKVMKTNSSKCALSRSNTNANILLKDLIKNPEYNVASIEKKQINASLSD